MWVPLLVALAHVAGPLPAAGAAAGAKDVAVVWEHCPGEGGIELSAGTAGRRHADGPMFTPLQQALYDSLLPQPDEEAVLVEPFAGVADAVLEF